jgi:hypothetical protein
VSRFGVEEAMRSYALESHTASSLVDIIERYKWTDDVDLVDGGHISLLFTSKEIEEAERDIDAAKRAGWSLEGVARLDKGVVEAVRCLTDPMAAHSNPPLLGVRCALSRGEVSRS